MERREEGAARGQALGREARSGGWTLRAFQTVCSLVLVMSLLSTTFSCSEEWGRCRAQVGHPRIPFSLLGRSFLVALPCLPAGDTNLDLLIFFYLKHHMIHALGRMARCRGSGASFMLLVLLLVEVLHGVCVLAFQPGSSGPFAHANGVHPRRSTRCASEGDKGETRSACGREEGQTSRTVSAWGTLKTKLSFGVENMGKLTFGTGAAIVAGFGAPETVDVIKG